jgi:hypothetical protein
MKMDKTVLNVSEDLKLPAADLVESAIGIIGKRGKGKTGLVKVLAEELVRVGLPFVWLDPIGIAWGLKSSFDGKGPGLEVLVVGGLHGDVRLDRRGGAEVARAVIEANVSAVIDFSQESKTVYREFVRDFAHELYRSNNSSRLVIVEEAPELVPQRIRPDMGAVFEAVERLVSRGRNNAIGVVLVSQRSATINKDVLSEIDALFVFGLVSPQDRKALKEWVEAHGAESKLRTFDDGIASLAKRECWAWSPEAFGGFFKKIYVSDFHTFHPDKTHLRRLGLLEVKPVTTDVSGIVSKLGARMELLAKEKTSASDATKLQLKVDRLERELEAERAKPRLRPGIGQEMVRRTEKEIAEAVRPLKQEVAELRRQLKESASWIERAKRFARTIAEIPDPEVPKTSSSSHPPSARTLVAPTVSPPRQSQKEAPGPGTPEGEFRLTKAHQRILAALVQLHGIGVGRPTKTQVALWAGYSPTSGGYANYLGMLRSAGLIDYGGDSTAFLTEQGRFASTDPVDVPGTVEDLQEQVFRMVGASRAKILKVAIAVYPHPIAKPELAERAGFSPTSGGYANYLGTLRSMGLIDYVDGQVLATNVLFLEGS